MAGENYEQKIILSDIGSNHVNSKYGWLWNDK
jgi:hypothetical protein